MTRTNFMRWFSATAVLVAAAVLTLSGGAGGCGSGAVASSPPVGIPAPVAGLISTTTPGADGKVKMMGAPGAVDNGASVSVSSASSSLASVTADPDGSFSVEFSAAVGDTVGVVQTDSDAAVSDATDIEIIPGRTPLSTVPFSPEFAPNFGDGCVAGVFGSDTEVDCFSPSTFALTAQFLVPGFQADDLALDDANGDFYLIQRSTDQIVVRDPVGGPKGTAISVTNPVGIVADATNQFALVIQENAAASITMIDDGGPVPAQDASTSIDHPTDGTAVNLGSFTASTQQDASFFSLVAVLSDFDNGDTVLTVMNVTPPPGGGFGVTDQISLGSGTYDSVVFFNDATEILISDSGRNQVIRLNGTGFGNVTFYDVGRNPQGIAVSEDGQVAFVCNHDDHTLSIIGLIADAVLGEMPTGLGVGLGPTGIAINASPFTGLVANDIDQTVSIFFIQDVLTALGF